LGRRGVQSIIVLLHEGGFQKAAHIRTASEYPVRLSRSRRICIPRSSAAGTRPPPRSSTGWGIITADLTRSPNRDTESPLANRIADAQLAATAAAADGGAQIAFVNPGDPRADLNYFQISSDEQPGEVTYGKAFAVQPFGNLLVTLDLTGAQIEQLLEHRQFLVGRGPATC
jgi:5'-nucleotidase, C-terminal domain